MEVLESNVTNGLADYLVLRNVDFRSAADQSEYTTEFKQGSIDLTHEFSDVFKARVIAGMSESTNFSQGLLVEFNRMDSQGLFVYDERGGGSMPVIDFGFDAADPDNWDTVKGFSAIRNYVRHNINTYDGGKFDIAWDVNPEFTVKAGVARRTYTFWTDQYERVSDLLNPTLREAGSNVSQVSQPSMWRATRLRISGEKRPSQSPRMPDSSPHSSLPRRAMSSAPSERSTWSRARLSIP